MAITTGQKWVVTGMGGASAPATPLTIFGDDLIFWFDNSNESNITTGQSAAHVASQTDETGDYLRKTPNSLAAEEPTFSSGVFTYNGTSNDLTLRTAADGSPADVLDDTEGLFMSILKQSNSAENTQVFNCASSASNFIYLILDHRGVDVVSNRQRILQRNTGGTDEVRNGSAITIDQFQYSAFSSDGAAWRAWTDGIEQTLTPSTGSNTGEWCGSLTGADNVSFFAWKRASAAYYSGDEKHSLYLSREPTAGELNSFFAWAEDFI